MKVSRTDPDAGYMYRDQKPEGFFWLAHRTVDAKHNFIVDVHVTPGNVSDSTVYLARLEHILGRFGYPLEAVALDAGYFTTEIAKALIERGVFGVIAWRRFGVIAWRRFGGKKGMFRRTSFKYVSEEDVYVCPAKQRLTYRTTDRHGYHHYASDPAVCKNCPLLEKCTSNRAHRRVITRHLDETYRELVNRNRLSESGRYLYRLRPQTVERSFADAKELHGLRFTFYRGTEKVQCANLVAATAQNMKKLANLLAEKDRLHSISSILCPAERLELDEHKKRRTKSRWAIWFVNSLKNRSARAPIDFYYAFW
ncbi:transposase [Exiguobacterium sp. SH0S7]|uniref:transposase n=1 Tax=Exiguobacterium sp. SH0S7 TaxID=2510951 RepID=UPI003515ACEB